MLKKKWKMIVLITIISLMFTLHFNTIFATVDDVANEDIASTKSIEEEVTPISENPEDITPDDTATTEQEVHEDDLYLISDSVTMDKLVDGNVYIIAKNAKITGKVNGNLYVCADELTFSGAYVRSSIYACANTIEFDGACNDLYVACNSINVTYDSYIVRDVHLATNSMDFIGAVGRNAHIFANSLNFGDEGSEKLALIYGNLNYTSPSQITIPDKVVDGEINYIEMKTNENSSTSTIYDYIISLIECIVFTFVVFLVMLWLTPNLVKKSAEFVSGKMGIGLGIGLISIIAATVISLLLLMSTIAISVAFAFVTFYILLASIGFAFVSICLTNKFAKDAKLAKKLGILAIVTIILWVLTQIPFIGGFIWFIITFAGLGSLLLYSFTKNKDSKNIEETVAE